MKTRTLLSFVLASLSFAGCSSEEVFDVAADAPTSNQAADASASAADADPGAADAAPDAVPFVGIPSWSLEDIQPESPQFQVVYGLNAFPQKILVAVLVEGF